jgi:hypothetical protein
MKINWKVEKKRGNFRPMLTYNISLEEHEAAIAMHAINIAGTIPRVPEGNRSWCSPCCDEREDGWQPESFHYISVPHFKNGSSSGCIRLPFRESREYPEVEESFKMLRTAYEEVVREVYSWKPVSEEGELNITSETKEQIAASIAAQKMLNLFGSEASQEE